MCNIQTEIANRFDIDIYKSSDITRITTDSRSAHKGDLFIALRGEKFDGHDYISQVLEKGCFVVSQKQIDSDRVYTLSSTEQAYQDIAGAYRSRFNIPIVGVTGSVGKSSTKEMIYTVLSSTYNTLKTIENLNNQFGVPLMLTRLKPSHEAAVIEMAMTGMGEIYALAKAVKPTIGVITNIGVSHLEALGSRENIFKAKMELIGGMEKGSPLILCKDNDLLSTVSLPDYKIISYGIKNKSADVRADNVKFYKDKMKFDVLYNGYSIAAEISAVGEHNVLNALAAFAVGVSVGITPENIVKSFLLYKNTGMRQNIIEKEYTIVEDCYNASPDSMYAALDTFSKYICDGRKILVLSDMLELGSISDEAHFEVGKAAAKSSISFLYTVGNSAKLYIKGALSVNPSLICQHFSSKDELIKMLKDILKPGDVIWFKASRGMKLEEVTQTL